MASVGESAGDEDTHARSVRTRVDDHLGGTSDDVALVLWGVQADDVFDGDTRPLCPLYGVDDPVGAEATDAFDPRYETATDPTLEFQIIVHENELIRWCTRTKEQLFVDALEAYFLYAVQGLP